MAICLALANRLREVCLAEAAPVLSAAKADLPVASQNLPIESDQKLANTALRAARCGSAPRFAACSDDSLPGLVSATAPRMQRAERRVVYILRSESNPERHYVGIASDPIARLAWHNAGPCGYTVTHRPWKLAVSIEFPTEREALRFERYLKSGSGRAFAKRHFAVT